MSQLNRDETKHDSVTRLHSLVSYLNSSTVSHRDRFSPAVVVSLWLFSDFLRVVFIIFQVVV